MFLRQSLVSQPDYMVLSGEFIFDLKVGGFWSRVCSYGFVFKVLGNGGLISRNVF